MNIHEFTALNERLEAKQVKLFDHLTQDSSAAATPALERLLHILDWMRLSITLMTDVAKAARHAITLRSQMQQTAAVSLAQLPTACDCGTNIMHRMQCTGLQEQLAWLQAAHGHGKLWCAYQHGAYQRIGFRTRATD